MRRNLTILLLICLAAPFGTAEEKAAGGKQPAQHRETFDVFTMGGKALETKTLKSREIIVHKRIYLVFQDKRNGRELFRMDIGFMDGDQRVSWWNYGIQGAADFNGDGNLDYAWYGGDDTSEEIYVLLSASGSYRKLDVFATVLSEWNRKFPYWKTTLEKFEELGGPDIQRLRFARDPDGLWLLANVIKYEEWPDKPEQRFELRIPESQFKYASEPE